MRTGQATMPALITIPSTVMSYHTGTQCSIEYLEGLRASSNLAAPTKCENAFSLVPVPEMGVSGVTFSTGDDHCRRRPPCQK
ncbi:hypothetical protein EDB83DRAFT_2418343 [Lactarius deliciosus]|nr:hypothetical protein EDB83DRAFT_2461318 [Lactarius deliciosus]KAH9033174.1 hypothetical protein EDB83DRAFT_2418343 [Lactarius deliciosus]